MRELLGEAEVLLAVVGLVISNKVLIVLINTHKCNISPFALLLLCHSLHHIFWVEGENDREMFLSATVFHTNKHFLHFLSSINRCTLDTFNKQIRLYVTLKGSPQVYAFLNRLLSVRQTFKKFSMNKCQVPSKRLNKSYSYKVYIIVSPAPFVSDFQKNLRRQEDDL